ncbi:MAG: hypothetical protein C3F07_18305 [Anaerolineales bacterium]|nr:MAG: hypothetical protein C3F07_18305 [Anaerolineales bacterium]
MNILVLALYGLSLLTFLLALSWILIPALYGLPSRPTQPDRIRKALRLVDLKKGEVLFDLGAGDGRVLFIAAQEFDAEAVGIEVGPVQCAWIRLRIFMGGLSERVRIKMKNYYKADLGAADVVFIYATSHELPKLASHLETQMKPGSRVVSISADFPEWEPAAFDDHDLIFTYTMPPREGSLTTYLLKKMN